jgi:hypothetical protein
MTRRGVRMDRPEDDLFEWQPPAPAAPPAKAAEPARAAPTNADCRRMERAIEAFKLWLLNASIEALEAADAAALAKKYPPIEEWDIAQMIDVRLRSQKRKAGR